MIVYFHFSFLIMNRKTNHSSKCEKDYQLVTSLKMTSIVAIVNFVRKVF